MSTHSVSHTVFFSLHVTEGLENSNKTELGLEKDIAELTELKESQSDTGIGKTINQRNLGQSPLSYHHQKNSVSVISLLGFCL